MQLVILTQFRRFLHFDIQLPCQRLPGLRLRLLDDLGDFGRGALGAAFKAFIEHLLRLPHQHLLGRQDALDTAEFLICHMALLKRPACLLGGGPVPGVSGAVQQGVCHKALRFRAGFGQLCQAQNERTAQAGDVVDAQAGRRRVRLQRVQRGIQAVCVQPGGRFGPQLLGGLLLVAVLGSIRAGKGAARLARAVIYRFGRLSRYASSSATVIPSCFAICSARCSELRWRGAGWRSTRLILGRGKLGAVGAVSEDVMEQGQYRLHLLQSQVARLIVTAFAAEDSALGFPACHLLHRTGKALIRLGQILQMLGYFSITRIFVRQRRPACCRPVQRLRRGQLGVQQLHQLRHRRAGRGVFARHGVQAGAVLRMCQLMHGGDRVLILTRVAVDLDQILQPCRGGEQAMLTLFAGATDEAHRLLQRPPELVPHRLAVAHIEPQARIGDVIGHLKRLARLRARLIRRGGRLRRLRRRLRAWWLLAGLVIRLGAGGGF